MPVVEYFETVLRQGIEGRPFEFFDIEVAHQNMGVLTIAFGALGNEFRHRVDFCDAAGELRRVPLLFAVIDIHRREVELEPGRLEGAGKWRAGELPLVGDVRYLLVEGQYELAGDPGEITLLRL